MGLSSFSSVLLVLAALQGPGTRLTYRIRVIAPDAGAQHVLASGAVSGPIDTDMRLTLRTDTAEVEALFQVTAVGDTVSLGGEFFTRRRVGSSRRDLPIWEEDNYRRLIQVTWADTARVYPFGSRAKSGALWVELVLEREFAGGEARPAESFDVADATLDFRLEAVVRPRRARVILNLVRGDTVSAPRPVDLVPEQPPRVMQLVLRGRATTLFVGLTRPEPARAPRDRGLGREADVVCLRVAAPAAPPGEILGTICGRLNNIARQLPLPSGDTLTATFAWPGPR